MQPNRRRHVVSSLLVIAAFAFGACGSGAKISSETIAAAVGGSVSLTGSNKSEVAIPAQSLAQDLEVKLTLKSLSSDLPLLEDAVRVLIIDPAGTSLAKGATIRIDPEQDLTDKTYRIYQLYSGDGETGWTPLDRSTIVDSDGRVETAIDAFGSYALVVKEKKAPQGPTGAIKGSLFENSTERPIAGETIKLMQGKTEIDSTVSGENGSFSFAEVPAGGYEIVVVLASQCYSGETSQAITVEAEKTANAYFGFQSICD